MGREILEGGEMELLALVLVAICSTTTTTTSYTTTTMATTTSDDIKNLPWVLEKELLPGQQPLESDFILSDEDGVLPSACDAGQVRDAFRKKQD